MPEISHGAMRSILAMNPIHRQQKMLSFGLTFLPGCKSPENDIDQLLTIAGSSHGALRSILAMKPIHRKQTLLSVSIDVPPTWLQVTGE